MRQQLLPAAAALLAAVACASDDPLSVSEVRSYVEARQRWDSRTFADYTFQVRTVCFCPQEYSEWHEVEVRSGVVTAVRLPGTTTTLPADRWHEWPTVEGLFTRILQAADTDHLSDIAVVYDGTLGYPQRVTFQAPEGMADGGSHIETRSVNPIP